MTTVKDRIMFSEIKNVKVLISSFHFTLVIVMMLHVTFLCCLSQRSGVVGYNHMFMWVSILFHHCLQICSVPITEWTELNTSIKIILVKSYRVFIWNSVIFVSWPTAVRAEYASYTVSEENVPPLDCYYFETCELILIFSGRNLTDRVSNQDITMAPQITCASALPGKMEKHKNPIFRSNAVSLPCLNSTSCLISSIFLTHSRCFMTP